VRRRSQEAGFAGEKANQLAASNGVHNPNGPYKIPDLALIYERSHSLGGGNSYEWKVPSLLVESSVPIKDMEL
jgi:hypothetical protein